MSELKHKFISRTVTVLLSDLGTRRDVELPPTWIMLGSLRFIVSYLLDGRHSLVSFRGP